MTCDFVWLNGRIPPLFLRKTSQDSTNLWKDSSARNVPRICIDLGKNLERRCFGRRHEEVEILDASEIRARRLSAKEANVWKRSWDSKIHFNAGPTCKK